MFLLSIFSFVKDFLIKIITDWRLLLLIVVLVISAFGYYKFNEQSQTVVSLQTALKNEKDSNVVLRQDITLIQANSAEKDVVIKQLQDEKSLQADVVAKLHKEVATSRNTASEAKKKLDAITTVPTTDVGQYIQESLTFIRNKQK